MNSPKFYTTKTKQLYTQLCEGKFAVPKLQRAFVWNGRKAAMLLDSIHRGMPIGSLTIWDTSNRNKNLLRHTLHILPPFKDQKRVWFVLDGQQRLSVLYRVFDRGDADSGGREMLDFNRIVFRITDGNEQPKFQYRKPVIGEWISVRSLLASNWRSRLRELTPGQLNRAERCRAFLQSYKVPLVRIATEDLEEARELFIRINSLGTPLGAADRAFARASRFDLRELSNNTWQHLPQSFKGIRNEQFLQTRALLDGVGDVGERAFEAVAKKWDRKIERDPSVLKQFTKLWDRQSKAIFRAIDCLRKDFSVLDDGLLPSENMVSTLAVFFYHHAALATPRQQTEIKKWFWATAVGQRYSGRGFRDNILRDAKFFEQLARGGKGARFRFEDRVDPIDLQRASYGRRSSIADGLYCLLISQKPAYLANGATMLVEEYASSANRKHKHHIFPRALLSRQNVSLARANSIVNLCFICGEENSQFGSKKPFKYLEEFQRKRYFARVMRSHLIPFDQKSGLWDASVTRGYRSFLKARTRLLCRTFERAAGMKLFRAE
jgi:hypothetical protein